MNNPAPAKIFVANFIKMQNLKRKNFIEPKKVFFHFFLTPMKLGVGVGVGEGEKLSHRSPTEKGRQRSEGQCCYDKKIFRSSRVSCP